MTNGREAARPPVANMPSIEQVNTLIRERRTIKPGDMSDDEVDRSLVDLILENANWAPTHGLTEPWRFRVFSGESRRQLAHALSGIYTEVTPREKFLESKHKKLTTLPLKSNVAILVWMKRQDIRKIPEIEEVEAVACAIQNMHLTASALGLAGFWSSPEVLYTPRMNEWMEIESEDRCLGVFYIGWPKEALDWPTSTRRPVAEKTVWVE